MEEKETSWKWNHLLYEMKESKQSLDLKLKVVFLECKQIRKWRWRRKRRRATTSRWWAISLKAKAKRRNKCATKINVFERREEEKRVKLGFSFGWHGYALIHIWRLDWNLIILTGFHSLLYFSSPGFPFSSLQGFVILPGALCSLFSIFILLCLFHCFSFQNDLSLRNVPRVQPEKWLVNLK